MHVVHRLLRRGKLHDGSRELHHRRAADPHQHDHGRPGRCIGRFASDGAVRARVRDFGTGLPSDIPERVFDRFFSTKREGMGIGLFIARSIVVATPGEDADAYSDLKGGDRGRIVNFSDSNSYPKISFLPLQHGKRSDAKLFGQEFLLDQSPIDRALT
jgi:hypothetical protein